jgi:hypothetical protein
MSGPAGVGIGEVLTLSAAGHPDTACFVHGDGSELSFGAVNERVNRLADGLEVTTVLDLHSGYEPLLATGRAVEPPALLERELRLWG